MIKGILVIYAKFGTERLSRFQKSISPCLSSKNMNEWL